MELKVLVEANTTEEVMYREALRLGLDKDDEIVRRRLVQKYEFLNQDLATPPEPTDGALRDYFQQHQEQYRLPDRVTFTHVYFSPDTRGEDGARAAAAALGARLDAQHATRAAEQGDRFPGPSDFAAAAREDLERALGREGLAQAVFGVAIGQWSGPLRSGFGWHCVYVSAREEARPAAFAEVRERVRSDWLEAERARRNADAIAALRAHFEIMRQ